MVQLGKEVNDTIPLVLSESHPEISCHFVVSKNLYEGVRVKQPKNHFDSVHNCT
jgi:hypothetical protein